MRFDDGFSGRRAWAIVAVGVLCAAAGGALTTIQAASGACTMAKGCIVTDATRCTSLAGKYAGDGTACPTAPTSALPQQTQPATTITGACKYKNGTCNATTQKTCVGAGGAYGGDGTICPIATGACKYKDGTCKIQDSKSCAVALGTYAGNSTTCP